MKEGLPVPQTDEQWDLVLTHQEALARVEAEAEVRKHKATLEAQAQDRAERRRTFRTGLVVTVALVAMLGSCGIFAVSESGDGPREQERFQHCVSQGHTWEDRGAEGHTCTAPK